MKITLIAISVALALSLSACNSNSSSTPPAAAPTNTVAISEQSTETQKVGYAIGFDMGSNFKEVADDMDLETFMQGMKDAYANKEPALSTEASETLLQTYMARKQSEMQKKLEAKAQTNKAAGETFLAENAKKEGVKTTASGLQYKVITEGSGTPPKASDTVMVNYEGKLIDGKVFDSSYERGEPVEFPLDKVIPGWTEGLQLMKPGAKYEFYIPSNLAYGDLGNPDIEPNSTLIFTVELLTKEQADAARAKLAANQEAQTKQLLEAIQQQADTSANNKTPADSKTSK